jgi:hypothetical protein
MKMHSAWMTKGCLYCKTLLFGYISHSQPFVQKTLDGCDVMLRILFLSDDLFFNVVLDTKINLTRHKSRNEQKQSRFGIYQLHILYYFYLLSLSTSGVFHSFNFITGIFSFRRVFAIKRRANVLYYTTVFW